MVLRFALLGDSGVGRSALVRRFVEHDFDAGMARGTPGSTVVKECHVELDGLPYRVELVDYSRDPKKLSQEANPNPNPHPHPNPHPGGRPRPSGDDGLHRGLRSHRKLLFR